MNLPEIFQATGCLLSFRGQLEVDWESTGIARRPLQVKGWSWLILTSSHALLGELSPEPALFSYPFLLRESGSHFLLLGYEALLVETLISKLDLGSLVFCPAVEVGRLVRSSVEEPGAYVLSSVFARIEGHGQNLRSMILYGSDVGSEPLFKGLLPDIQPFRVGLKRVATGQEVLSIGSRGEINFLFKGSETLRKVDKVLAFLARGGYILWDRPLAFRLR